MDFESSIFKIQRFRNLSFSTGFLNQFTVVNVDKNKLLFLDFEVIEQISFPERGTTLTPNHNFGDFKFKSYAPIAFRYFRDIFEISTEDFLHSGEVIFLFQSSK